MGKRKIKRMLFAFLMALYFSLMLIPGVALATTIKDSSLSDSFKGEDFNSNKWEALGEAGKVGLNDLGGSLVIKNGQFHTYVMNMGYGTLDSNGRGSPMTGSYTMEFVYSMDIPKGQWMAVSVGLGSADTEFMGIRQNASDVVQRGSIFIIDTSSIHNYTTASEFIGDAIPYANPFKNDGTQYKMKIELTNKGTGYNTYAANTAVFYHDLYDPLNPDKPYPASIGSFEGNISVDGYFAFSSFTPGTVTISKLKVTQGANVRHNIDFAAEEMIDFMHPTVNPMGDKRPFRIWCDNVDVWKQIYTTGRLNSIKVEGANASASLFASKAALEADQNTVEVFEINCGMRITQLTADSGASAAILFGMDGAASAASAKAGLYFTNSTVESKVVTTVTYKSGNPLAETDSYVYSESGADADIVSTAFAKYKIIAKQNGGLQLFRYGILLHVFEGAGNYFGGRYAFAALGDGAILEVNDYNLYSYKYIADNTAKNRAINFSETDEDGIPVYSDNEWYFAGNAFAVSGAAVFSNTKGSSFFGPREAYGDFVMKFDIRNISQGAAAGKANCGWFGVTFGRASLDAPPLQSSTFRFEPAVPASGNAVTSMMISGLNIILENGDISASSTANFFEDGRGNPDKQTVNVVVIAYNRRVEVYYKYKGDPEYMLNTPRAVFADVNTAGFVAVCCDYDGNFAITNFSIRNIGNNNYIA